MMPWPPSESEWAAILREVPAADHAAVRSRVAIAVQEYQRDGERYRLLNTIAAQARTKFMRSFCANLGELHDHPVRADFKPEWFLHLATELAGVSARVRARAEIYSVNHRKRRLYAGVLRAWTGADERRRLGASERGPAQRFLCRVAQQLGIRLSQRGARRVIDREHDRRDALIIRRAW